MREPDVLSYLCLSVRLCLCLCLCLSPDVNGFFHQDYWGKVKYDKSFDLTDADCQQHIHDWCHDLKYSSGSFSNILKNDE